MKKYLGLIVSLMLFLACGGTIKSVDKELPPDLDFYNPNPQGGGLRLTSMAGHTILIPMTGTTKTFTPNAELLFASEQGKLFARDQSVFKVAFDASDFAKRTVNPGSTIILHFLVPYAPSVKEDLKLLAKLRDEMGKDKLTVIGIYFVDIEREKKEPTVIAEEAAAFGAKHSEIPIYQADLSVVKKLGPFDDFPHTIIVSPKGRIIGDYAGPINKEKLMPLLGM